MKIAIMQPYFFPYTGYFKLISEVDTFVFLDDVQYIRRGWMNRNKINNSSPFYITVPVKKCPRNTLIKDIETIKGWSHSHLKSFVHVYGKKVFSNSIYEYYKNFENYDLLNPMLCDSIIWMSKYLKLKTKFEYSSNFPSNKRGQERIIDICKKMSATTYCNLPNGNSIYSNEEFDKNNIMLKFINTEHHKHISILESCFNEHPIDL
jgi:hypothetical protein